MVVERELRREDIPETSRPIEPNRRSLCRSSRIEMMGQNDAPLSESRRERRSRSGLDPSILARRLNDLAEHSEQQDAKLDRVTRDVKKVHDITRTGLKVALKDQRDKQSFQDFLISEHKSLKKTLDRAQIQVGATVGLLTISVSRAMQANQSMQANREKLAEEIGKRIRYHRDETFSR